MGSSPSDSMSLINILAYLSIYFIDSVLLENPHKSTKEYYLLLAPKCVFSHSPLFYPLIVLLFCTWLLGGWLPQMVNLERDVQPGQAQTK